MDKNSDRTPDEPGKKIADKVGKNANLKIKARREGTSIWAGMGVFGIIGWSVALPTVLGTALGLWIDQKWPGSYSWTLMLMVLGLVLGCINAWRWVKQEGPKNEK